MKKSHDLKTWPEQFQAVKRREKRFEVRKNDRDYQVGDLLVLREFCPNLGSDGAYSGDVFCVEVTHMLAGGQFGIEDGYCVLSIGDPK